LSLIAELSCALFVEPSFNDKDDLANGLKTLNDKSLENLRLAALKANIFFKVKKVQKSVNCSQN